jgi:dihydroneopterin aldolase
MKSGLTERAAAAAPDAGARGAPVESGPDRIVISDLRVQALVGLHAHERGARQELRLDVEVETVPGYAAHVRETGAIVCYGTIAAHILDRAAEDRHVDLVETWAEEVAAFVLDNPLAARVTVCVTKTGIVPQAGGVGVRITRTRGARP